MRVVFMGTPQFAVPTLEALLAAGHEVALVVTQPDRPVGRGQRLTAPPVATVARSHDLPLMQPSGLRRPEVQEQLAAAAPRAIVVAAYARMLPAQVLDLPPLGCVNVHPSLLPRHRGPAPIQGALLAGDAVTGTSIIRLVEQMDAGPILAQATLPITDEDDAESLEPRLAAQGASLLVDTLPRLETSAALPREQDESAATYTRLLTKDDGRLDWTCPAADLARQIRACAGWPGAFTEWRGQPLKVLRATVVDAPSEPLPPGRVFEGPRLPTGRTIAVATPAGALALGQVALAGRRPTAATDFVQGYRDFVGATLPS